MAIQIQGNGGTVAEVDGTTFRALRVTPRPVEFGTLGVYSKGLISGTMAAGLAANGLVGAFRWGDASNLCLVTQIRAGGGGIAAFAAGFCQLSLSLRRSYTASSSGGTGATLTGNNGKLRTAMGTTLLTDMRISSTAALTAGTSTGDTDPAAVLVGAITVTAGDILWAPGSVMYNCDGSDEYPVVFAQNEGFQLLATVPATGTWTFGYDAKWYEVASY